MDSRVMTYLDIVFDGPPSHKSGRFVEAENPEGHAVCAGEWIDRGNGLWALRIGLSDRRAELKQMIDAIDDEKHERQPLEFWAGMDRAKDVLVEALEFVKVQEGVRR